MSFKVSVIIPNYNHALFLPQRIQSVLNQSFQDFELILLDDCSTDDSQSIIDEYRHHPKVSHVVYNESNSGSPFKQWAKGVALAQGAYIWIAESDDFAEASFLERCITQLDKHAGVGLVYCDSNIIAHDLLQGSFKEKNKEYYPATDWTCDYLVPGMVEIERHLINNCSIYNVSAVLFRKEKISNTLAEIIKLRYAGDWLSYLLIGLESDIYYIADVLNNYRSHADNTTKKSAQNYSGMYERIAVRAMIAKRLKGKNERIKKRVKALNLMELRAIFGGFVRGRVTIPLFYQVLKFYF